MYIFSILPCILKATSVENPVLPLSLHPLVSLMVQDSIDLLLDAVRTSNEDLAQTWKKSEQWATIEQLCSKSFRLVGNTYQIPKGRMAHQRPLPPSLPPGTVGGQPSSSQGYGAMGGPSVPASSSAMWSCLHCTFMNQPGTEHCEMCSLPRS